MIPPIRKTVTVPLPPDQAFELFTERMGEWWPMDTHSVSASSDHDRPAKDLRFEAKAGGKVTETLADGSTADWATVTRWAPGEAFELDWYPGQTDAEATRVAVTFTAVPDGTRVDLVHDRFEARGTAAETLRDNYNRGWDPVMMCFQGRAVAVPA